MTETVSKQRKSIRRIVAEEMDRRLNPIAKAMGTDGTAFKVFTDDAGRSTWMAVWTNNFEDREGEFFSEKAINDYIKRVAVGIVPPPELWVWHGVEGKSVRIGQAKSVDGYGHFGIAYGEFDETPLGQAAAKHYRKHWREKTLSHGFTYPIWGKKSNVYETFNSFEISLLPRGVEANLFTSLEGVKDMKLTPQKEAEYRAVFGDQFDSLLESLDTKGKALRDIGVAYKDFADMGSGDGEETPTPPKPEDGDEEDTVDLKALIAFGQQMVADNASLSAALAEKSAKEIEGVKATGSEISKALEEVRGLIADLKEQKDNRPREASKDAETKIDPDKVPDFVKADMIDTEKSAFFGVPITAKLGE